MNRFLPPLCLLFALASVIAGFTLFMREPPQPSVELHEARFNEDEEYRELLEDKLERDRNSRTFLTAGLFVCAVGFTVAGFMTMRPSR